MKFIKGNPVSAIVTYNLVVVPSINKLMGYENPNHKRIKVKVREIEFINEIKKLNSKI